MAIILESERLTFRAHEPADLEAYCAMESDAEVRRYVGGAPRTREAAEHKFRNTHLKRGWEELGLKATIFKAERHYIGYCGLYSSLGLRGPVADETTLAFYLSREYWGKGLATEAGRTFIEFGFTQLRLKRIVATVEIGNAASVRVLEKLGFFVARTETGLRSFHHFELPNRFRKAEVSTPA